MAAKVVLVVCTQALLLQTVFSQFLSNSILDNSIGNVYASGISNVVTSGDNSGLASIGSGFAGIGSGVSGIGSGVSSYGSSLASVGSGVSSYGSGVSSYGSGLASVGSGVSSYGSGLASIGSGVSSYGSGLASVGSGLASVGSVPTAVLTGQNYNVAPVGPLVVTSVSPISPNGVSVASENGLEGVLAVNGQLPFLSVVAFEGSFPTAGSGVATCGCGNGNVAIVSEGLPSGYGVNAGSLY